MLVIFQEVYTFIVSHPLFVGVYLCFQLIGVFFAFRAIYSARTSQGAIAWVGSLLTVPIVSVPLFVLFGIRGFDRYASMRSKHDQHPPVLAEVRTKVSKYLIFPPDPFGRANVLRQLTKLRFTGHNDAELLIDGEVTFKAIIDAIKQAEEYIVFQFYILRCDDLGERIRDALIERAQNGVRIYLLYDRAGSFWTKRSYFQSMRDAGIEVVGFTTYRFANPFQLNFRNHRKIVVVDGHTAFVGGHNIGVEYLGEHPKLTPWRDTHMRVQGPAVMAIQFSFVEDWRWATDRIPELKWDPVPAEEARKVMFVLPSSPADDFETCGLFFQHAINSAEKRIWIASPYLVPDEGTLAALQLAAFRGVDVRLILPGMPDHRSTWWAAHSYFEEILDSGVRIFQMNRGFMHQKVTLLDDAVSVIGTANFDNRSFRLNFEISVITIDGSFAREVEEMLLDDISNSTELTIQDVEAYSLWLRIASRTARLLSPIL